MLEDKVIVEETRQFVFIASGAGGYPIFVVEDDGEIVQIAHSDDRGWATTIIDALNMMDDRIGT